MKHTLQTIRLCVGLRAIFDELDDFEAELKKKRDKEQSFIDKGHLSECSTEIARVLVLRYKEILGE